MQNDAKLVTLKIYKEIHDRYVDMAKGTSYELRVLSMMEAIVDNCLIWPGDKLGRWVGYVQCIMIEIAGLTTIEDERDFTRPLFHDLYKASGIEIPLSVKVE